MQPACMIGCPSPLPAAGVSLTHGGRDHDQKRRFARANEVTE